MRVFFIGFGQAGGKIVDMFIEQDKKLGINSFRGIAVNTARTDLMGLKNIEMKDRILIGQTMVKGHGVGTDNVTGAASQLMKSTASSVRLICGEHMMWMHSSLLPALVEDRSGGHRYLPGS